ncbi:MAG: hypothetical protein IID53_06290 [Proteobacteria bacterium]|nr:hypothetical protein [Pseudomonadota bacterium]
MFGVRINISEKTWRGWLRGALAMLRARPKFGPISQGAGLAKDSQYSWLHISVSVKRLPFGRRDIPCCRAYIRFINDEPFSGDLQLKWQSDLPRASNETILILGGERKIPLILREDGDTEAELTDWMFFAQQEPKRGVKETYMRTMDKVRRLPGGEYRAIFVIKSGDLEWESPEEYVIKIPKAGRTNSHFSITSQSRRG